MTERTSDCQHQRRVEGVCVDCGHCLHELVLNGACYYCGTQELDGLAMSPKPNEQIIPVSRLGKPGK